MKENEGRVEHFDRNANSMSLWVATMWSSNSDNAAKKSTFQAVNVVAIELRALQRYTRLSPFCMMCVTDDKSCVRKESITFKIEFQNWIDIPRPTPQATAPGLRSPIVRK
jgi:hypothetical protein